MQAISECYCKLPSPSMLVEGYCGTCFGKYNSAKVFVRAANEKAESLEDFMRIKSEISEKAYIKTVKVLKLVKSSSSSYFPEMVENQSARVSLNKRELKQPMIPEERAMVKKINHMHTESHPNTRAPANKLTHSKSQAAKLDASKSQLDRPQECKSLFLKHHDRALSTRIPQWASSSIADSDFQVIPESPELRSGFLEENRQFGKDIVLKSHRNAVNAVTVVSGTVYTAGSDYSIVRWPRIDSHYYSGSSQLLPVVFKDAHSRRINSLEMLSPRLLVSVANEPKVKIWKCSHGLELTSTINSQEAKVTSVAQVSTQLILTGGGEGVVKLWDLEAKIANSAFPIHHRRVVKLCAINNNAVLSAGADGIVKLVDLRAGRGVISFGHCEEVRSVRTWNDVSFYSAADKLRKWDLRSPKPLGSWQCEGVNDMEKVKDKLVTAGQELISWEAELPVRTYCRNTIFKCAKFSSINQVLYVGCSDADVIVRKT